jgi:two-component system heavy metal sensor histidine kinase CusS
VDAALVSLRWLLWGSASTAVVVAALVGAIAIRKGLAPIGKLAVRADAIDAHRLGERLPVEELPRELRPAVVRINELLSRLEASFARERQLGADVSHELRTPIAGLRSILEVASSRERAPSDYRDAMRDALGVVEQMGRLCENLLLMARLDARRVEMDRVEVELRSLVDECFSKHAADAEKRGLTFENRVAPGFSVQSDREMLRIVLENLIGNAVAYTSPGGWLAVDQGDASGDVVAVRDSGPPIPDGALEKIFERFVRLDAARSGGEEHSGIGLSLVRSLCDALSLSVAAENRPDGSVAFRLRRAHAGATEFARP